MAIPSLLFLPFIQQIVLISDNPQFPDSFVNCLIYISDMVMGNVCGGLYSPEHKCSKDCVANN